MVILGDAIGLTPIPMVSLSIRYSQEVCMNYKIMNVKSHDQLIEIVAMLETLDKYNGKDFVHDGIYGTYTVLQYSGIVLVLV